ncbi:hypothetical protein Bpla01_16970 [Burkholderia plantarii]|nr:hypothetical protein Bpla01_16970 [Burkholderia plantarii]
MRAAAGRLDAERVDDMGGAFVERARGDDEMVQFQRRCGHLGSNNEIGAVKTGGGRLRWLPSPVGGTTGTG